MQCNARIVKLLMVSHAIVVLIVYTATQHAILNTIILRTIAIAFSLTSSRNNSKMPDDITIGARKLGRYLVSNTTCVNTVTRAHTYTS